MTPSTAGPDDTPAFRLREATRADLLSVFRIEQASFPTPWPFQAFERFVSEPGFIVACDERSTGDDGGVMGYIVADSMPNHGNPIGHVKDFAVHPDYRGNGIGSALLQRALSELSLQGVYTVKLEVREGNTAAIGLYQQHGFELHHSVPRYYDNGETALVLIRD